jgi:hypothetical protein
MDAIKTLKNQFRGINPHLNSALQGRGGDFPQFHHAYIEDLSRALQRTLLPKGYEVSTEKSLQIRRPDHEIYQPYADVAVTDPQSTRFNAYSPSDRARILTRLLAIYDAGARGDSFDADPQPLPTLELDEAISQWTARTGVSFSG